MTFPTIPTSAAGRVLSGYQGNNTATRTFPSLTGLTKGNGDLLIAIAVGYQTGTGTNAAFSGWGGGFTEFHDSATTTTLAIGCAYKWSTGAETGTFTVTQAATVTGHAAMILLSIPGVHPTSVPEAGGRASGTATTATPGSLDPAGWATEETLWIALGAVGEDATTGSYTGLSTTPPTNYGSQYNEAGGVAADVVGAVDVAVAFRQLSASSEDPGNFGNDTSNSRWGAITIAIRPGVLGTASLSLSASGVHSSVGTASLSLSGAGTAPSVAASGTASLSLSGAGVVPAARSGTASLTLSANHFPHAYQARVMNDAPILYYRQGESSGATTAVDSSSFGDRSGTYVGSPTFEVVGGTGDGNTAVTYNAGSTYTRVDATGRSALTAAGVTVSYEFLFKTTQANAVFMGTNASNIHSRVRISNNSSGRIITDWVSSDDSTVTTYNQTAGTSHRDGKWHHCVVTRSGATVVIYIDGSPVTATGSATTTAHTDDTFIIGGTDSIPSGSTIDEVAIYDYVLTDTDVSNHFGALPVQATATASLSLSGTGVHSSVGTASLSLTAVAISDGVVASIDPDDLVEDWSDDASWVQIDGTNGLVLTSNTAILSNEVDLEVTHAYSQWIDRRAGTISFQVAIADAADASFVVSFNTVGQPDSVVLTAVNGDVQAFSTAESPVTWAGSGLIYVQFVQDGTTTVVRAGPDGAAWPLSLAVTDINDSARQFWLYGGFTDPPAPGLLEVSQINISLGEPRTGTASLSLSGSGGASGQPSGTGALSLSGSGDASAESAAGTGSLSLSGAGATTSAASATASLSLSGTGAHSSVGSGSISLSFTGSAQVSSVGAASLTLSAAGGVGYGTGASASLTLASSSGASAVAAAIASLDLVAAGSPATADEIFFQDDFEGSYDTTWDYVDNYGVSFSSPAPDGSQYVVLTVPTNNWSNFSNYGGVFPTEGGQYEISFYAKRVSGTPEPWLYASYQYVPIRDLAVVDAAIELTDEWQYFSFPSAVDATLNKLYWDIYTLEGTTGDVWALDRFRVTRVATNVAGALDGSGSLTLSGSGVATSANSATASLSLSANGDTRAVSAGTASLSLSGSAGAYEPAVVVFQDDFESTTLFTSASGTFSYQPGVSGTALVLTHGTPGDYEELIYLSPDIAVDPGVFELSFSIKNIVGTDEVEVFLSFVGGLDLDEFVTLTNDWQRFAFQVPAWESSLITSIQFYAYEGTQWAIDDLRVTRLPVGVAAAAFSGASLDLTGSGVQSSVASAALSLAGSGSASVAGIASASLDLAAAGSAGYGASGTAFLSVSGTGAAVSTGVGSALLSLSGSADMRAELSASGSLELAGSGAAGYGTASTASLSLSGTGVATVSAIAAATLDLTGSAVPTSSATASASLALNASGNAGNSRSGTASLDMTGTGVTGPVVASASASLSLTGAAVHSSMAAASLTLAGAGATTTAIDGSASLDLSASGMAMMPGTTGAASLSLSASGAATVSASASGFLSLNGSLAASTSVTGAASLTVSMTGVGGYATSATASLSVSAAGAVTASPSGSASITLLGSATPGAVAATGTASLSFNGSMSFGAAITGTASVLVNAVGSSSGRTSGTGFIVISGAGVGLGGAQALASLSLQAEAQAIAVLVGAATLSFSGSGAASTLGAAAGVAFINLRAFQTPRQVMNPSSRLTMTNASSRLSMSAASSRLSMSNTSARLSMTNAGATIG